MTILYLDQVGPVSGKFVVYYEGVKMGCNQTILYIGQVVPAPEECVV